MKRIVFVALLGACGEPVIDMHLEVPSDISNVDTSCMQAFTFIVDGGHYPTDLSDYSGSCINIDQPPAKMADLPDALRGRVDTKIPQDGLSAVEIYGLDTACTANGAPTYANLIFQGAQPNDDSGELTITAVKNAACSQHSVTVKPVDMFKLIASPTHDCTAAALADGPNTAVYFGTYFPYLTTPSDAYYGDVQGGMQQGGVVTAQALDDVGPDACLALNGYDGSDVSSTSCALDTPPVCATGNQKELAMVSYSIVNSSVDQSLVGKYGGYVVGSVWASSGGTKAPVQGATVSIDGMTHAEVHYVNPTGDLSTTTARLTEGANSTGASGLFVLYTSDLTSLTISANGKTQHARVAGSSNLSYGAAMIMMP